MLSVVVCDEEANNLIASDDVFDVGANKFLQRQAGEAKTVNTKTDEEPLASETCPVDLELSWMTEVSASVYATPLVTDLYSDGHKDVVVPAFVNYLEVLEGANGAKAAGWPVNHKSTLHISPVMVDCDFDGVPDIVVVTYDAEITCYSDQGRKIGSSFQIEALQVRKDWYVGLQPDHVDHSHPDVGDPEEARVEQQEGDGKTGDLTIDQKNAKAEEVQQQQEKPSPGQEEDEGRKEQLAKEAQKAKSVAEPPQGAEEEAMTLDTLYPDQTNNNKAAADKSSSSVSRRRKRRRSLLQEQPLTFGAENMENGLTEEAEESFGIFSDEDEYDFAEEGQDYESPEFDHDPDFDPGMYDEAYEDYDGGDFDYADHYDDDWGDEYDYEVNHHPEGSLDDYLSIDAHVLCTPTVVDIDQDGYDDLIIAVTYLFDHETYSKPERKDELGDDVDISNYLASGVLAFDFLTQSVKWHQHLDLSTHHVNFQAYMYSSPTVADLDLDGKPEIIVGTSVGFVYAMNQNGTTIPGWPIQMGEVQAQVVVEDINDDGLLEVVACDSRGNVAAFNPAGKEIWERHLGSLIANSPTVGDINGDGKTELVLGTGSGTIFAPDGISGKVVLSYQTNAMIMSSVLLAKLDNLSYKTLHLVTMSFDGFLYLVDGSTGCADIVDIGETSYSMVLYDDLDNDGFMDLLVSTMNGNVYSFKTRSIYDPLKTWPSQVHAANGFATKLNRQNVAFAAESRAPRDISGKTVALTFLISDKLIPNSDSEELQGLNAPYTITLKLKGVRIEDMNAGQNPVVGLSHTFSTPGEYTLEIPCPRSRTTGTIEVWMTDKYGKTFSDSFSVSFHMSYYRIIKWLLALPMIAMSIVVIKAVPAIIPNVHLPS
jgi:hypothetical protein